MPVAFLAVGAGRRGARARRDPLPLRPAARDAARHLGHQPVLIQTVRIALRRAERRGREPALDVAAASSSCSGLVLPWNRIAIIVFAVAGARWRLAAAAAARASGCSCAASRRTARWPRAWASAPRASTRCAFALGSGIAGLGGCALSQIGNVGPDLGQSYIVDSFMVVVLGGVGQLAGTVVRGARPRRRQQVARAGGGRGAGEDRRARSSSSSSSRSGRRACSRSRAGARRHEPCIDAVAMAALLSVQRLDRFCVALVAVLRGGAAAEPRGAARQLALHVRDYAGAAGRQVHVLRDRARWRWT